MIRWLLNLINPGRNKSNVYTDTPGGVNGMTWEKAKKWLDKGYKVGRVDKPKEWYVYESYGLYIERIDYGYQMYEETPADKMSRDWQVRKEGV